MNDKKINKEIEEPQIIIYGKNLDKMKYKNLPPDISITKIAGLLAYHKTRLLINYIIMNK